jgi:hypothetical protein
MKWMLKPLSFLPLLGLIPTWSRSAAAAPCAETGLPRPVYGAGGSAVTPTMKSVAVALANLPEEERVTIYFSDPGACSGYEYFRNPDPLLTASFRYWDPSGTEATCEAPQTDVQFAHMGNTPALCPGDVPLPDGAQRFVAPVQTVNIITNYLSQERSISAEALFHVFGFGPGASGRTVSPWNEPNAVFVRKTSSFVHQMVAVSLGVPAASFKLPSANFLGTNADIVTSVFNWGDADAELPEQALGYVSGSNAKKGEEAQQTRSLAYQHFDQSCAYLPDSAEGVYDRKNVRSGQYWLWTPAWFYAFAGEDGLPEDPDVKNLVGWFDGTIDGPGGIDTQGLIVSAGDVPLCAMQAIRPDGDLSAIQSYAPPRPCNGWYEFKSTGTTDYQQCETTDQCDGNDEVCRFGFCEAY